jgi:hypothetical protein
MGIKSKKYEQTYFLAFLIFDFWDLKSQIEISSFFSRQKKAKNAIDSRYASTVAQAATAIPVELSRSDRVVNSISYASMHSVEQAFPSTDSDVLAMDIEGIAVSASLGTYVS